MPIEIIDDPAVRLTESDVAKWRERYNQAFDARWLVMTVSISAWLSKESGLPVDFQFQPRTHANERHKKPRNALGMRMAPRSQSTSCAVKP